MRFYVLDNQSDAIAIASSIDARARTIYEAQGYTVDTDGNIIGKRASDGESMPDAARTETWDIPRQRLDGKWVLAHCEGVPGAAFVIDANGTTVAQFVAQDIPASVIIETDAADWWPMPPEMGASV